MEKVLVSVHDKKASSFGAPVAFRNVDEAIRQFCDLCSDTTTLPGKHPDDFELVLLGTFDDDAGYLQPDNALTLLKAGDEICKETLK